MLHFHARRVAFRRKPDLDFGRTLPVWVLPGEHDSTRRLARRDVPDYVLLAIGKRS